MHIDIESLEKATLDAVAPSEVGSMPDWLLPYDHGTVGRAISAVPVRHDSVDPSAIPDIEALYAKRGLQARFRIAHVAGLASVEEELRQRGYTAQKPTLTLVGTVDTWPTVATDHVQLSEAATDAWSSVYLGPDFDPVDGANRVRALARSKCLVYASIANASGVVAAGNGAFSQGWVSLHGLRTVARERGKGHASAMIAAFGAEARARGLNRCFLQVDEDNTNALRLYRALGFEMAWSYRYWRK